jgi:hypothetical protein
MNIKSLIGAASLALLPMLSQAGVVYEWQATNNAIPRGVTFKLEFEESAVKSGGFHFDQTGTDFQLGWPRPDLGLIYFDIGVAGAHSVFDQQYGFSTDLFSNVGELTIDVTFGANGLLEGSIRSDSFETGFTMSSNDGIFTIHRLQSDGPVWGAGCDETQAVVCAGATGVISRVDEIPEPGSLALIGAGLFAASRIRRRKEL